MHNNEYEVILVINGLHVKKKEIFENYLHKEGFAKIANEEFAYMGKTSLPLTNTRAYVFDTLIEAMKQSVTNDLSFICQLGDNSLESYSYDIKSRNFKQI